MKFLNRGSFAMLDLQAIKKEFLDIYSAIQHLDEDIILHGPVDTFGHHFDRLNVLAAMDVDDEMAEELRRDRDLHAVLGKVAHLKRINGLRLEIEAVGTIINSDDPWREVQRFVYYPNYLELARMEYHGAGLGPGDLVVFLGSGPLPLSLISLCRQYGISGIGIEQDPRYAVISEHLLMTLDLDGSIRIIQGNHYALPLADACSLIMVGADARPKDEIFAHLASTLPDHARISYRIYEKGLRRLLDTHATISLPAGLEEYARIRPDPPVNNTSVFVIKRSLE